MDRDGAPDRGDGTGTSAAALLSVLEGMRAIGIEVAAVCAATRISLDELETRETFVSPAQVAAVWREGTRLYGRPTIGIAVAMATPKGSGIVDYVASTSATLRQALEQVARYHRLITQNADVRLQREGDLTAVRLLLNLPAAAIPAQILEYATATLARRVVELTGKRVRGVQFPHAPLGPREEYARVLGVPVGFEAETAGVLVDDELLAAPCRGHEPNLFKVVRAHAELLLEKQPKGSTTRAQARRVLIGLIAHGEPEMGAVARTLATSERSLQRRLQEEGTSFREVVDEVRKELALGYLGDRRMAVSEVAYLLGYSEAGAFVRAFKRWTGTTPSELRAHS